jgi:hypothetical protein
MSNVARNNKPPIYTEILSDGAVLTIGDKPRIVHENGNITGLCLDLRFWYDRKNGFVERKERTDKDVILLGKKWANELNL